MDNVNNNTNGEVRSEARTTAKDAREYAKTITADAKERVTQMVGDFDFKNSIEELRKQGQKAVSYSSDIVKQYPFSTVAGAAALGVVAGLLLGRRK